MLRSAGSLLGAISLALLAGCRINVEVPAEGGRVISNLGMECVAGQTCVTDPSSSADYSETFQAVADPGYVFTGWQSGSGFLCGNSLQPCLFATNTDPTDAGLTALLDGDIQLRLRPVFAPEDDRYVLADWQALLQTLNTSAYRSNSFLYQVQPNTNNCDPGVLKPGATGRFVDTLNLIRKLHYLPEVDYDAFYNTQMQQTSLVQWANGYLSHSPSPGDDCYSSGAVSGAGSSNLSWSSQQQDPASYPLGWVNDNRNMSSLMAAGHRRWALYPNLGYTSYGQAAGYAAMKVFNFGSPPAYTLPADLEYVAFPYRNYPYVMVSKGSSPTPWSLSMVPASGYGNHPYFSAATITVREVASGVALNVHSRHTDSIGYGLPNFLSWMVDNWQYDTPYLVTISNISLPGGATTTVEYPVEIDYAEFQ